MQRLGSDLPASVKSSGFEENAWGEFGDRSMAPMIDDGSELVMLNVYSLSRMNGLCELFGFGFYHTAVQVYDREYSYGGHEYDYSGIV